MTQLSRTIVTAEEMRRLDTHTFQEIGVPSRAVMESAGREVYKILLEQFTDRVERGVAVIAGTGNNGGDGYVVARNLLNRGISVEVLSVTALDRLKGEALDAATAYQRSGGVTPVISDGGASRLVDRLATRGVIVDAIFGTGFHGNVDQATGVVITALNQLEQQGVPVLAIDLPSGVDATEGAVSNPVVKATATVALQFLKWGHLLYPGALQTGDLFLADIGIHARSPKERSELLSCYTVARLLRERFLNDTTRHKGGRGHVLVVGGGAGHHGAPIMSGAAALRSGAGLVTVLAPRGASEMSPVPVELMTASLEADEKGGFSSGAARDVVRALENKDAVVIGPGMGQERGAHELLREVVRYLKGGTVPTVFDADALNLLASDKALSKELSTEVVLTPHPGEMARLLGVSVSEVQVDRKTAALRVAKELGVVVVLKGARTVVASPAGEVFLNPAATEVLGTAGSGDVLAGMIAAMMARGYSALEAACVGVYVHGAAGEQLALEQPLGTVASDIVEMLPRMLNAVWRSSERTAGSYERVLPERID